MFYSNDQLDTTKAERKHTLKLTARRAPHGLAWPGSATVALRRVGNAFGLEGTHC